MPTSKLRLMHLATTSEYFSCRTKISLKSLISSLRLTRLSEWDLTERTEYRKSGRRMNSSCKSQLHSYRKQDLHLDRDSDVLVTSYFPRIYLYCILQPKRAMCKSNNYILARWSILYKVCSQPRTPWQGINLNLDLLIRTWENTDSSSSRFLSQIQWHQMEVIPTIGLRYSNWK